MSVFYVLSFIWGSVHLSSISLLSKNNILKYIFLFISLIALTYMYLNITIVGDVKQAYIMQITNIWLSRFELGFKTIIAMLYYFDFSPYTSLVFLRYLSFLLLLVLLKIILNKENRKSIEDIYIISFIILSHIFFFLGIENVVRQGLATIFIGYSIFYFIEKKYIMFLVFSLLAQGFHKSSIMFIMISILSIWLIDKIISRRKLFVKSKNMLFKIKSLNFWGIFYIALFGSLLLINLFPDYLISASRNNDRMGGLLKPFILGILFYVSSFIWFKNHYFSKYEYIFLYLRNIIFAVYLAYSFLLQHGIEMASRVFIFYLFLEMILMLLMYKKNIYGKIGTIFLLVADAFAINIYTLLTDIKI